MKEVLVRHCGPGDYDGVLQIYNHYIEHSPATFDIVPFSLGARAPWFAQFAETGPYQLLVALSCDKVVAYCCSTRFKSRQAYEISIETSAYVAPEHLGQGIGKQLYAALFASLPGNDLHGAYAGITLPNDASVALHSKLGFRKIGVFEEVGRKFDRYWSVAWFEKRIQATRKTMI